MIKPAAANPGTPRTAALHRQGDQWRLVILAGGSSPLPGGGKGYGKAAPAPPDTAPTLLASLSLPFNDANRLRAALEQHGVTSLLRILPASVVICRVVDCPAGNEAETAAALSLIAEATLPAGLPSHRRAAARLDGFAAAPGSTPALLLGWAGNAPEPLIPGIDQTWTAEPVALLHFIRRRARSAMYADRATGSVSVIAAGARRLTIRALREDPSDASAWLGTISERFDQTATASGVTPNGSLRAFDSPDTALRLDVPSEAVIADLQGVPADPEWFSQYGLALAAAAASLSAPPFLRPLFSMTSEAPADNEPAPVRFARALASPRRALWTIAAALSIALLVPLALAAARHAVLASKTGGLARQQQLDQQESLRAAFFDQLEKRRWPMTSILADLTAALPIGVTLESLRLEVGQRVALRGKADSLELVNQLQARLNESGVFAEASIDRTQKSPDSASVEFDASTRIVRPHTPARGLEDFAERTLAQRLYGDRATNDLPVGAGRAEGRTDRLAASAPAADRQRASRAEPKPADIPPPITDEQIRSLDATAAMKEWTNRQKASKQSGLDAATRDRLKDEAEKCRARMLEARRGGGA